jgi:hypothetical protein
MQTPEAAITRNRGKCSVIANTLPSTQPGTGRVEVFVAKSPLSITDEHPADRDEALTRLEPVARPGERLNPPGISAVPADSHALVPSGRRDRFARLGEPLALDGRTTHAFVGRGRLEQIDLGN